MMYDNIQKFIQELPNEISPERQTFLTPFIAYMQQKLDAHAPIRLNLICTHNSRRSHLSQIWAQVMAFHFDIPHVFCYSGGTESTAIFQSVVESLRNTGFKTLRLSDGTNPVYAIKYAENELPIICFSKKYNDPFNPSSGYAGVLTCSQVDEACPIIIGAEARIPVPYEDPKKFDNTPEQLEKYTERSRQIASEMMYVFSQLKPANVKD